MRMDTTLSTRMSMQQVLAPRMIQSMEILQLPIMALQERIEHELQENPVLELKEAGAEAEEGEVAGEEAIPADEGQGQTVEEYDPANDPQQELVIDDKGSNEEDFDRLAALSEDWA